jgi:hypothetical protein
MYWHYSKHVGGGEFLKCPDIEAANTTGAFQVIHAKRGDGIYYVKQKGASIGFLRKLTGGGVTVDVVDPENVSEDTDGP